MPCWEVNLVTLEFKVHSLDNLVKAIEALGYKAMVRGTKVSFGEVTIDLETQKAECPSSWKKKLTELKREYSVQVIKSVATKKRWSVRSNSKFKVQLRKVSA